MWRQTGQGRVKSGPFLFPFLFCDIAKCSLIVKNLSSFDFNTCFYEKKLAFGVLKPKKELTLAAN